MTINTTIPSLCLSPGLPEAISISTTYDSIEARLYIDNTLQWTADLFAFQGEAILYDIRTVIESKLRSQNMAWGACELVIKENGQYINGPAFSVIISEEEIPNAATWLQSHFLTSKTAFRINRSGQQKLSWYAAQGETMTYKIIARYMATTSMGGSSISMETEYVWTQSTSDTVNEGVYDYSIDVASIEAHFNKTLLCFTVERGSRRMTFYVDDETPSINLRFRNQFNVQEMAGLFVDTNKKVKMEASEAKAIRKNMRYDFQKQTEYEVVSAPISLEDAKWLAQMVASRFVEKLQDGDWKEIIIDGESEVDDKANAENIVKFSYKFAKE